MSQRRFLALSLQLLALTTTTGTRKTVRAFSTTVVPSRQFTPLSTVSSRSQSFVLGGGKGSNSRLNMSTNTPTKKVTVLVPIADGSEEIETTCVTDTLTRFGADVTIASVMPNDQLLCTMSRGIKVMADMSIEDASKQTYDLIVCPGGMPGAAHLRDSKTLIEMLQTQQSLSKKYAAICAAPAVVLATHGLLVAASADDDDTTSASADAKWTCYPAPQFREKLINPVDDEVAVTGSITTSKGPGTALAFALELGEQLFGKDARDKIQKEMLV